MKTNSHGLLIAGLLILGGVVMLSRGPAEGETESGAAIPAAVSALSSFSQAPPAVKAEAPKAPAKQVTPAKQPTEGAVGATKTPPVVKQRPAGPACNGPQCQQNGNGGGYYFPRIFGRFR